MHSEKVGAAGTYKSGFGFHPLLCFKGITGETLAGLPRSGSADANAAADQISVLDDALAQLPDGAADRGTLLRCDSAGGHARLPRGGGRAGAQLLGGLRPHPARVRACLAVSEHS